MSSTSDRAAVMADCIKRFLALADSESIHTIKATIERLEFERDFAEPQDRAFIEAALERLKP